MNNYIGYRYESRGRIESTVKGSKCGRYSFFQLFTQTRAYQILHHAHCGLQSAIHRTHQTVCPIQYLYPIPTGHECAMVRKGRYNRYGIRPLSSQGLYSFKQKRVVPILHSLTKWSAASSVVVCLRQSKSNDIQTFRNTIFLQQHGD